MIVLDTSVAVELLLGSRVGQEYSFAAEAEELHAPSLIDIEIIGSLRRLVRLGLADEMRATFAVAQLESWDIVRHDYHPHTRRAWQLRGSVSPYDAIFVALAEYLDVPLWTRDGRLSRSHGHRARIILLQ